VISGVAVIAGLVVIGAVLGVEVVVAGAGPKLDEFDPHLLDGPIGVDPAATKAAPPLHIVWLGDSTAAGVGASSTDGAVARQVGRRLGRPITITVLAESGARVADVAGDQIDKLVDVEDVDLVVISVGANDAAHLTSLGDVRQRYEAIIAGLPPGIPVVIVGVPDMGAATRLAQPLRAVASARADQVNSVVREVAQAHDAAFVNIGAQTGPAFRDDPDFNLASDHYHPSDAGYGLWADAIVPVVVWELFRSEHPNEPVPPLPSPPQ
jgi:lysophospholipase L1-like esterase